MTDAILPNGRKSNGVDESDYFKKVRLGMFPWALCFGVWEPHLKTCNIHRLTWTSPAFCLVCLFYWLLCCLHVSQGKTGKSRLSGQKKVGFWPVFERAHDSFCFVLERNGTSWLLANAESYNFPLLLRNVKIIHSFIHLNLKQRSEKLLAMVLRSTQMCGMKLKEAGLFFWLGFYLIKKNYWA